MLHVLLCKNKIIGVYSDYKKCTQMLDGLVYNKFARKCDLKIQNYYDNSITQSKEYKDIESEDDIIEVFTTEDTTEKKEEKKDTLVATDELDETGQIKVKKQRDKRSKMEYNISLLKKKKEQIEESKNIYKNDVNLFNKFKKFKLGSPTFEIPELFQNKYDLMTKLEEADTLNWETFNEQYTKQAMSTSYNKLFGHGGVEKKIINVSSSDSETPK